MAIFNSKLLVYQRVKWTQQILTGADRLRAQWARGRRGTTWHNPHQKYVSCSAPPRKLDFLMCQIVSNICDSAVESRHPMCFFGISIILCHHMFGEGAKNQNERYHQAVFRRRMQKNQKPSSSIIPFSKNSIPSMDWFSWENLNRKP